MALYRIFHLTDVHLATFRERPPDKARTEIRPAHYEQVGEIEADTPYEAWSMLRDEAAGSSAAGVREFGVGDVLQIDDQAPQICRWWGFEECAWHEPGAEKATETSKDVVQVSSPS